MSTKRLSEKYSALHHATLGSVLDNFGLREEPEAMALRALEEDRLQAREDVKRLAERLRERIGGKCCDFAYATTGTLRCPRCAADETLLAEVEAVRQ